MAGDRLKGKICIITGTGGSMGRAAALMFAREGAVVVGCDINVARAEATIAAVHAARGEMISLQPCDLTEPAHCKSLIAAAINAYGRIDVLFNNAAFGWFAWIEDMSLEDWNKTFNNEVNLVFLLTQAAWPHLKRNGASVINTASAAGLIGVSATPSLAHSAAKAAVHSMTRQMAVEGRRFGIRVNSISPGPVETEQTRAAMQNTEWYEALKSKVMLDRFGQPEEIAATACFLASDESSFITATDIRVDGGCAGW